jgi:hypothetical protein
MNKERAQELRNSSVWNDFVMEVDRLIAVELQKLRRCSPDEVVSMQSRIDTFEFIRNLPDTIIERES